MWGNYQLRTSAVFQVDIIFLMGFSMILNGLKGKKCEVEIFPDMNGSQSPHNVVCTPTFGDTEHDPLNLDFIFKFQWIWYESPVSDQPCA